MVRTLILFIVLFFSCPSYAGECQVARLHMFSGGEITAPDAACSAVTGTVTYLYNGDYTSDTDAACSASKIKIDGTLTGTATANYFFADGSNKYLTHELSSAEWSAAVAAAGTIWFSVYFEDGDASTHLDQTQVLEIGNSTWDTNNKIRIYTGSDGAGAGYLMGEHEGEAAPETVRLADDTIALTTWYRCGYSWSVTAANPDHAIMCTACGGGGTEADCAGKGTWVGAATADDDLAAMTTTIPNRISLGERDGGWAMTDNVRVADVRIHSGFQAADTF